MDRCVDSRRFFFAGFCFGRRVFVRRVLFRRGFVRQFCYRLCLFTVFFSPFFCSPGCFRRGCFRQVFSPVLFAGVSFVIFVQEGLQLSKWRALKRSVRADNRNFSAAIQGRGRGRLIHDNRSNRMASAGDESFKYLTYQLPTLGDCPLSSETLEMLRSRRGRGGGEQDRGAFRHRGGHHPERTCTADSHLLPG